MKKIVFLLAVSVVLVHSQAYSASVEGYIRKDGTYVAPYQRTNPDHNPSNNYNYPGNYNPNTGRTTPGNPDTYLDRYNNKGHSSGSYDPFKPYGSR
jgi:hypothetical protein